MNPYEFIFKGENSRNKGVMLSKTPAIIKPKMRNNQVTINGRPGTIIQELGYSAYEKILEFYIKEQGKLEEVQGWLFGEGELTIFNEPDKIYDANILEEVEYIKNGRFYTGKATFFVQPYKRALVDKDNMIALDGNNVQNNGNIESLPVISITGTGTVEVFVNNSIVCTLAFGEKERTLVIDAEAQECFYNGSLANRSMSGTFPTFSPGSSILTTTGNVTQITYRKGERWI